MCNNVKTMSYEMRILTPIDLNINSLRFLKVFFSGNQINIKRHVRV